MDIIKPVVTTGTRTGSRHLTQFSAHLERPDPAQLVAIGYSVACYLDKRYIRRANKGALYAYPYSDACHTGNFSVAGAHIRG
jgi:hypothetical protein